MLVLEKQDSALYTKIQEKNLIRQYDLLTNCIEIGLKQGPTSFDKYMLWSLNHAAVANISQFGGRFRNEPIYVGNHTPPHFREVPDLMDRFISFIHENWYVLSPTQLAAYALWRMLWIHPFIEGNGRTARGICYYILSARIGRVLPGKTIVRNAFATIVIHISPRFERQMKLGKRATTISTTWQSISPGCCRIS
jgi:fido (protein-threonine AMPylation protein)